MIGTVAILYPEYEVIKKLFTKPEEGEMFLLDFLKDNLSDEYEVFFQSSISGMFPDVIILHKGHGMMIIEVKDWRLSSYLFDNDMSGEWSVITERGLYKIDRSPLEQVLYYKKLFYNDYSLKLNFQCAINSKCYDLIYTAVFFYNQSSFDFVKREKIYRANHVLVLGRNDLKDVFKELCSKSSYFGEKHTKYFNDDIYYDIQRLLLPSEISREKIFLREDLTLDSKQLAYATSPDKEVLLKNMNGFKRKIRGFPGSGKTLTLVNRAVNIILKHKIPVLIIVFNITMVNKIHDLLTIFCEDKIFRKQIEVTYYHKFILNYSNKYNISIKKGDNDYDIWIDSFPKKYPAILIDECQDFRKTWIDCIHNLLQDNGEMLIVADERQHIYSIDNWDMEDSQKIYTGIGGQWPKNFNFLYPYSSKMQYIIKMFKNRFILDDDQPVLFKGNNDKSVFHYLYDINISHKQIFQLCEKCISTYRVNNNDFSIVGFDISMLRLLDEEFNRHGVKVSRVFESQYEYDELFNRYSKNHEKFLMRLRSLRRTYRFGFYNESGKIKISTIHSFKGWRTKFIVLILNDTLSCKEDCWNSIDDMIDIENSNGKTMTVDSDRIIYTAISRAESSLIVINMGCNKYHEFFSSLDCIDDFPFEI